MHSMDAARLALLSEAGAAAASVPAALPPSASNKPRIASPAQSCAAIHWPAHLWGFLRLEQARQTGSGVSKMYGGRLALGARHCRAAGLRWLRSRWRKQLLAPSPAMRLPAAAWEAVRAASSSAVRPQGSSGVGWRLRLSGRRVAGSTAVVASAADVKAVQVPGWSRPAATPSGRTAASCWAALVGRMEGS